jgi:hypothetical protein
MFMRKTVLAMAVLLVSVLWSGCGGGGGGGGTPAQKSAEVTFSTASPNPGVQIKGIFIAVILPEGVTVDTEPGSNQIRASALQGAGNGGQVFGTYSAPIRKVKIGSISTGTITLGPYARLNCDVLPGYTLTESQFTSIVPVDFQPTGPNGAALNDVSSSLSVVFGH